MRSTAPFALFEDLDVGREFSSFRRDRTVIGAYHHRQLAGAGDAGRLHHVRE